MRHLRKSTTSHPPVPVLSTVLHSCCTLFVQFALYVDICHVCIVLSVCTRYACKEMAKGTRPFNKQMVFQAICQLQPMVVHHRLSVVDCRTFREAVTAEERVHTGCHPFNLSQFVQHSQLRPFLKLMNSTLNAALGGGAENR